MHGTRPLHQQVAIQRQFGMTDEGRADSVIDRTLPAPSVGTHQPRPRASLITSFWFEGSAIRTCMPTADKIDTQLDFRRYQWSAKRNEFMLASSIGYALWRLFPR